MARNSHDDSQRFAVPRQIPRALPREDDPTHQVVKTVADRVTAPRALLAAALALLAAGGAGALYFSRLATRDDLARAAAVQQAALEHEREAHVAELADRAHLAAQVEQQGKEIDRHGRMLDWIGETLYHRRPLRPPPPRKETP